MKRFNSLCDEILEMMTGDVIPSGETAPYEGDDPAGLQGDFYARGDARNARPEKNKRCALTRKGMRCEKGKKKKR